MQLHWCDLNTENLSHNPWTCWMNVSKYQVIANDDNMKNVKSFNRSNTFCCRSYDLYYFISPLTEIFIEFVLHVTLQLTQQRTRSSGEYSIEKMYSFTNNNILLFLSWVYKICLCNVWVDYGFDIRQLSTYTHTSRYILLTTCITLILKPEDTIFYIYIHYFYYYIMQ